MAVGSLGQMNVAITATDMASGKLASTQSQLKSTAASARQVGMGMATIGAVGTAAIGASVNEFAKFEDQMVEVQKVTGMTDEEVGKLGDRLQKISSGPMPASSRELGKIAAQAGSIGVRGEEAIADFTTTVQKMAVATRLTSDEAAEQMARISKAFEIPIDKAENLGSTINALSNNTSAWSDEISQALRRVAPAANQMGVSMQEASGMVATLISRGVPARRAGTKLRRVFQMMATDADKMAKVVGVSTEEMQSRIQNDAVGSLEEFIKAAEESGNSAQVISDTFGAIGASAVSNLTNLDQMNSNIEQANTAFKEASSLQSEYQNAIEKTSSNVQNLKDRLQNIAITVGGNVAPILNNTLFPAINSLLSGFQNLDKQTKKIISVVGALGSAALLLGGGLLFVAGAAIPTIMTGLSALGTLVGAISLPMIAAAAAVGALGYAIATNFMGIRDSITEAMSTVWKIAKPILNALMGLFKSLTAFMLEGISRQVKFLGKLVQAFSKVFGFISPGIKNLGATLITTFFTVVNALKFVADNWHKAWDAMGNIVGGAVDWIIGGVESLINTFIDGVNSIIESYNRVAEEVPGLGQVGTLGEFSFGGGEGLGSFNASDIASEQREQLDNARVGFAEKIAGEGAGQAVEAFQNAVEGVAPAMNDAGKGLVDLGGSISETADQVRNSDLQVSDIQNKIDGMMSGSEKPDQSQKEQKKQTKQLKRLRQQLSGGQGQAETKQEFKEGSIQIDAGDKDAGQLNRELQKVLKSKSNNFNTRG